MRVFLIFLVGIVWGVCIGMLLKSWLDWFFMHRARTGQNPNLGLCWRGVFLSPRWVAEEYKVAVAVQIITEDLQNYFRSTPPEVARETKPLNVAAG